MDEVIHKGRSFWGWFVKPYAQIKLGIYFLLVSFVFAFFLLGFFAYYLNDMFTALDTLYQLSKNETSAVSSKLIVPLVILFGLCLLFIGATLFLAVRVTHKIYGPALSIERYLQDVVAGKSLPALKLRSDDELQGIAVQINRLMEKFSKDSKLN